MPSLVSALLSGGGAPRRLIRLCLERALTPLVGAELFAEYDDVLGQGDRFQRSTLDAVKREAVFDALMSVSAWTPAYYLWRPNLPDAGDDHLVELAIAGGAAWIVTTNLRDLPRRAALSRPVRRHGWGLSEKVGDTIMSVMTIRLPDAQHERLRQLARTRGVSINKVIEELATRALTEFDLETRFHARAGRGNPNEALCLLDREDGSEASEAGGAQV